MSLKNQLTFYLNGERRVLQNVDPTQTVLDYVRSVGLTGAKLGCQEGGCGACTMTFAEWDEETQKPYYYAINGCIVPLIAVDGKHLITVEALGTAEQPHAIQDRLAKFHGSQCGFCTPGIVMSLYTLLRDTNGKPTEEMILDAFDGNLCRCTGYRPIIDAANTFASEKTCNKGIACCRMANNGQNRCCGSAKSGQGGCCKGTDLPNPDEIDVNALELSERALKFKSYPHAELSFPDTLKSYRPSLLEITGKNTQWYRPVSLRQLHDIIRTHEGAKLVSGASEFTIETKIRGDEHSIVVFLKEVPELKKFEYVPDKGIMIGGNISLAKLEKQIAHLISQLPSEKTETYTAICAQLKLFAGTQIRNVGSPAGNLANASPIADFNPILAAANATVFVDTVIEGQIQEMQIPIGNLQRPFFVSYRKTLLPPRSVITRIFIPESRPGEYVHVYKQAKRKDDDISIVTACMRVKLLAGRVLDAALAYGGVAPVTVLAKMSSKLIGRQWDKCLLADTLNWLDDEFKLSYDVPGGAAVYRRSLVLSFFYQFFQYVCQKAHLSECDDAALSEVTRAHPVGVQTLQNNFEREILGKSEVHMNAMRQVTGESLYVDDIPPFHNELFAAQVMSRKARAHIRSIDYAAALEVEGVVGYVDVNDVEGNNKWGLPEGQDCLFVENGEVNFAGACISVICATNRESARKAARLVRIEYDHEEEPIITIEQAIEQNSYFPVERAIQKGNISEAFRNAAFVFEGISRMGAQEHFYLEPQGCIVVPEDNCGEFKIYSSSQNPNEVQLVAAGALRIPANRIVARVKRVGGGFGGKETRSIHYSTIAAVAAKKFKRPVRLILSRSEDMIHSGQRHPFLGKWKVALDKNYKFIGLRLYLYANAGSSIDLTRGVLDRAMLHFDNCYDFGAIDAQGRVCKTNIASNTAFRGFGGPQGMFVAECIINEVSDRLNVSPDYLRSINYYPETGGTTPYRQNLGRDFSVRTLVRENMAEAKFEELRKEVTEFNKSSKWIKRGLAHVPTKFGVSFGVLWLNQAGALVHIYEDGSVLVAHGGTEIGQGINTKMAMIAAQELAVPLNNVFISETSTQTVANASPTAASATSDLNGMAVKNACDQLNERLLPYRKRLGKGATMKQLAHDAYFDRVNLSANGFYKTPDIGYIFGDENPKPAFLYFTQGSAISMVEVNMLTGDWANLRTDIKMDIGRTLNLALDYGQIEGAFVQGQGLFTIEESLWLQNGSQFTCGPGTYKIPGFRDIPQQFNISVLQDREFEHLNTINRSKGIGEPPLFLGSAVFFALRDAIKAARADHGLSMPYGMIEAPLTTENIRVLAGDDIARTAQVKLDGKNWFVRA